MTFRYWVRELLRFSVVGVAVITGCAQPAKVGRHLSDRSDYSDAAMVDAPALLQLNSLLLYYPRLEGKARQESARAAEIYQRLVAVASEELTLQLHTLDLDTRLDYLAAALHDPAAIAQAARNAKADGAMVPFLLNYSQRMGSRVGVNSPARIDLIVRIYRASDGQVIWEYSYQYSDRALSDNILTLGDKLAGAGGAGWATAEQLLDNGLRAASREFSQQRSQQFLMKNF